MSHLSVVNSQIAVRNIPYLVEVLAFAADLKQKLPVDKEITGLWIAYIMPLRYLIAEKCLAKSSGVNPWGQRKHHGWVVDVYLVRLQSK